MASATPSPAAPARHRPKSFTVFAAAFIAGAAAAVGVNRVLDVQLAQRRPQVECEPIFVALRTLPQGAPITVWDVALKDWPKAMLPSSALRAGDTFEGCVLRHAVREGQPLLSVQLVKSGAAATTSVATETFTPAVPAASTVPQSDPWMPGESLGAAAAPPAAPATPTPPTTSDIVATDISTDISTDVATEAETEAPSRNSTDSAGDVAMTEAATAPQAEQPAAAPSATEPTPIEPPAAATITETVRPMPPSPATIDPPAQPQPTVAGGADPEQMSEAVATDVQAMPSVMKAVGQPVTTSASPPRRDAGRYLVVPERIALQADTSFTTPRPQPPGPPATATPQPTAGSRPAAATAQPTPQRPTPQRPTPQRAQTARGQPPQRPSQPPKPTPPGKTVSPGGGRDPKQAAAPRPWGGMFPNVAAGLEAMSGSWQRAKPTAQQTTPATQPTRR